MSACCRGRSLKAQTAACWYSRKAWVASLPFTDSGASSDGAKQSRTSFRIVLQFNPAPLELSQTIKQGRIRTIRLWSLWLITLIIQHCQFHLKWLNEFIAWSAVVRVEEAHHPRRRGAHPGSLGCRCCYRSRPVIYGTLGHRVGCGCRWVRSHSDNVCQALHLTGS